MMNSDTGWRRREATQPHRCKECGRRTRRGEVVYLYSDPRSNSPWRMFYCADCGDAKGIPTTTPQGQAVVAR